MIILKQVWIFSTPFNYVMKKAAIYVKKPLNCFKMINIFKTLKSWYWSHLSITTTEETQVKKNFQVLSERGWRRKKRKTKAIAKLCALHANAKNRL